MAPEQSVMTDCLGETSSIHGRDQRKDPKVRGWLELPVMEEQREDLPVWSVTGKTPGAPRGAEPPGLPLERPTLWSETSPAAEMLCATASEKALQGQDSQRHAWSRGCQQQVWSGGGTSKGPSRQNH